MIAVLPIRPGVSAHCFQCALVAAIELTLTVHFSPFNKDLLLEIEEFCSVLY